MSLQPRILLVAILASFVAFLDGSVVTVALPAIAHELGGGLATQQWVVDGYMVTLGALMLAAGSLSDQLGRTRVLYYGLVGFGLASVLCAVAPDYIFLIAVRALQGVAGALLVPSSLALIISTFRGTEQGRAIGSWTAWTGIAFVVGPLLGGFLVDAVSWRLIFAINVLPIAITVWLMRGLPAEKPAVNGKVDYTGALLCAFGLGASVYALIEQGQYGWGNPLIYGLLLVGVLALTVFVLFERLAESPMLPLSLFGTRNFSVGNVATAAIYAGLAMSSFLITIFVQQVGHYTALEAGLATLPVTILMFFLSPRFGALSARFGPRWFMAAGPLVAGLGFLSMLDVGPAVHYWTHLLPGILLFGVGLSITVAPLTAAILGAVDSRRAGIASAVNNAVARIAGLLGVAALGPIAGNSLGVEGFHRGVFAIAVLLLGGGAISAGGISNRQNQVGTGRR